MNHIFEKAKDIQDSQPELTWEEAVFAAECHWDDMMMDAENDVMTDEEAFDYE